MARRRPIDPSDWQLWQNVVRTVTPLRGHRPAAPADKQGPAGPSGASGASGAAVEAAAKSLSAPRPPVLLRPEPAWPQERILPSRRDPAPNPFEAMEPRLKRKLMRGQLPIDARIDLHGMRQADAEAALHRFIPARFARGDRTLLVITGKGLKKTGEAEIVQMGVLRAMLPVWLAAPALAPLIAGFERAAPAHGGEGAWYVRLRREPK